MVVAAAAPGRRLFFYYATVAPSHSSLPEIQRQAQGFGATRPLLLTPFGRPKGPAGGLPRSGVPCRRPWAPRLLFGALGLLFSVSGRRTARPCR